ncbi:MULTISPECIES: Fe-S cluster assembly protein SufD [Maricaulis]|uniref:Iron-regulated ABC transporter permease protein SufD n=1 Tax=Maricaulis maris (strain MCS10) TaxID=394221 RepID=Q0AQ27_MARMM|nr:MULTISPECIES: Fe-S cluster assembly protein SufD [Maricaulis]ABI65610.1 Iron-regulated ABC transporter permease protein SufD [Maricaulis maris MCS10]MAC90177.1 Fe-S cluster assembly protein SufD [Maricaulis sp.]
MTATLTHTPAEQALIDVLDGATGWSAQLREATRKDGLPTRRHELWKWSDLRRAANDVTTAGMLEVTGADALATIAEGDRIELSVTASGGACAGEAELVVPAGVRLTLIERLAGEAGALGNWHMSIRIEAGAWLDRIVVADHHQAAVFVGSAEITLAEGAHLNQTMIDTGAKLSRNETHIYHPGQGATVDLGGAYVLAAGRHADTTTVVHHAGPGCQTKQLVKGAVASGGHGVFQGKFIVDRIAQQTDARMTHRALMLGEKAEIDAKPELEIYADDVQCAHGNALGTLDETALFYMRQRGLPEVKARALLIESYLAEPLDMISDEALREELKSILRQRLGALS